ncbi:MAG: GTPase domain-containing protein [Gammaproteobacteria bacterium]
MNDLPGVEGILEALQDAIEFLDNEQHRRFLGVSPDNLTPAEVRYDRSGRLRAWISAAEVVKSIPDLFVNRSGPPLVGLLGHFTSGKSTLINALIQRNQRAVGPHPTDTDITLICHPKLAPALRNRGLQSTSRLHVQDAPINDFTEKVILVDTPGLGNSEGEHNLAERILHLCHVIILTVDGGVPLASTGDDLALFEKALIRLGPIPKIIVITKSSNFLSTRKGDYAENWDSIRADELWAGVVERALSDPRFARSASLFSSLSVVYTDAFDGFNIQQLRLQIESIIADPSHTSRVYTAQVHYIRSVVCESFRVFEAYLESRLRDLNLLHAEASSKAEQARTLVTSPNSVRKAVTSAKQSLEVALNIIKDLPTDVVPPSPHETGQELSQCIVEIEQSMKHSANARIKLALSRAKTDAEAAARFIGPRRVPGNERALFHTLASADRARELRWLELLNMYVAETGVSLLSQERSLDFMEKTDQVVNALAISHQIVAGGLGQFTTEYNVAADAFLAYITQPDSRRLLSECGVVLFRDDGDERDLRAAKLSNREFPSYPALADELRSVKESLGAIAYREDALDDIRLGTPNLGANDFLTLLKQFPLFEATEKLIDGFEAMAVAEIEKASVSRARAVNELATSLKAIWLQWLATFSKVALAVLILSITISLAAPLVRGDMNEIPSWLYGWSGALFAGVVGTLLVETIKYFIKAESGSAIERYTFGVSLVVAYNQKLQAIREFHTDALTHAAQEIQRQLESLETGVDGHVREFVKALILRHSNQSVIEILRERIELREQITRLLASSHSKVLSLLDSVQDEVQGTAAAARERDVDQLFSKITRVRDEVQQFVDAIKERLSQLESMS